ncbi:hypothetical protein DID88_008284 [Monilinia fructigena]|uniref:Uncharacterized protein n=1 Tax=Monilinia fructigena TaxID=38457 RepID=A0A395J9Y3_9HELO|nr:hypothetical protein DID88_008284 [Monilinia fructigena]
MSNPTILLLGTLDTKGEEILYLRTRILVHSKPNTKVLLADVGQEPASDPEIDIPQSEILSHASSIDYSTLSRGEYIEYTSTSATNLFSTMAASGNSGPYFGETDITMMYSVVDIAGINSLLKGVLDNAAGAISGLAQAYWVRCKEEEQANRAGGKAMERLIRGKRIDAVLDITTTEIADYICGGVLSAGPERLSAAAEMGIPQIVEREGEEEGVGESLFADERNEYVGCGGREFFDSEADKRLFEVIKNELDGTGIDVLEKDSAV